MMKDAADKLTKEEDVMDFVGRLWRDRDKGRGFPLIYCSEEVKERYMREYGFTEDMFRRVGKV